MQSCWGDVCHMLFLCESSKLREPLEIGGNIPGLSASDHPCHNALILIAHTHTRTHTYWYRERESEVRRLVPNFVIFHVMKLSHCSCKSNKSTMRCPV